MLSNKLFLVVFNFLVGSILCLDSVNDPSDGYGRAYPNQFMNGFFPVWAIMLLCLAGTFLLISLIAFILYLFGCRPNNNEFKKLPAPK